MALRDAIQRLAVGHRFYGYRRIAILVQREGYEEGTKKVRRLMKEDNLLAVRRRKFVATTDSEHDFVVYPNLAEQLIVSDVNQLWVADITTSVCWQSSCIWRWCWKHFRGGPWVGRWGGVCRHPCRWRLWKGRSAAGNPKLGWYIIPSVGRGMPATTMGSDWRASGPCRV